MLSNSDLNIISQLELNKTNNWNRMFNDIEEITIFDNIFNKEILFLIYLKSKLNEKVKINYFISNFKIGESFNKNKSEIILKNIDFNNIFLENKEFKEYLEFSLNNNKINIYYFSKKIPFIGIYLKKKNNNKKLIIGDILDKNGILYIMSNPFSLENLDNYIKNDLTLYSRKGFILKNEKKDLINKIVEKSYLNSLYKCSKISPYFIFLDKHYGINKEKGETNNENNILLPSNISSKFSDIQYQLDGIKNSIDILNKEGGVLIADSVGLGKSITGIMTLLNTKKIGEKSLIVVPPNLISSWKEYITIISKKWQSLYNEKNNFIICSSHFSSLKKIYEGEDNNFDTILIDESHTFRNKNTKRYEYLKNIIDISGIPNIILLSATPINNKIKDLKNIISLFRIETEDEIKKIEENNGYIEGYSNGKKVREETIINDCIDDYKEYFGKFMVRRLRGNINGIIKYKKDLEKEGIVFPKVELDIIEWDMNMDILMNIKTSCKDNFLMRRILFSRYESSLISYKKTLKKLQGGDSILLEDIDIDNNILKNTNFERESIFLNNLIKKNKKDPKYNKFLSFLKSIKNKISNKNGKLIIFSMYADTVEFLFEELNKEKEFKGKIMLYSGKENNKESKKILNDNFVSGGKGGKINILITTDILSEGVNLGQANKIINYDIPWNPVRIIQRQGRINRIKGTFFKNLYIWNILPLTENNIKTTKDIVKNKVNIINEIIGSDNQILDTTEVPNNEYIKNINLNIEENENEENWLNEHLNKYYDFMDNQKNGEKLKNQLYPLIYFISNENVKNPILFLEDKKIKLKKIIEIQNNGKIVNTINQKEALELLSKIDGVNFIDNSNISKINENLFLENFSQIKENIGKVFDIIYIIFPLNENKN